MSPHICQCLRPGIRHWQIWGLWGANALNVDLRVRFGDVERARELIESLELGKAVDGEHDDEEAEPPPRQAAGDGEGPYRNDARPPVRLIQPKSQFIGAVLGFWLTFGMAHHYAGEFLSGLVLAIAQLFAMVLLIAGQLTGFILLALVIGIDIGTGVRAITRANAGKRLPPLVQLGRTVPLVLAAALFAALFLHTGGSR